MSERSWNKFFFCFCCLWFFETIFLCFTLAVLELAQYTRLSSNSQISTYLCLLSTGIKSLLHHHPARNNVLMDMKVWLNISDILQNPCHNTNEHYLYWPACYDFESYKEKITILCFWLVFPVNWSRKKKSSA